MATSNITNVHVAGAALDGVAVIARLKPGPGFRVDSGAEVDSYVETTYSSGSWTLALERTANITPSSSWWEIEERIPDSNGGPRVWPVTVGSSNATLAASLVTPSQNPALAAYLTQAAADLRYAAIGAGSADLEIINVMDYGAVGDGVTNDYTAIQAAINAVPAAGGQLYFPSGTYLYNTTPTWKNYIRVTGQGSQHTILKAASGVTGLDLTSVLFSHFENIRVDGSGAGIGIKMSGTTYLTTRNVHVNGHQTGLQAASSSYSCIFDNLRIGNATSGMTITSCNDFVFRSLEVSSSSTKIALVDTTGMTFDDYRASGTGTFLTLAGTGDICRNTVLRNCYFDNSTVSPYIDAGDAQIYGLTLIGNTFTGSSGSPPALVLQFGGKGIVALNNIFTSCTAAIELSANADGGLIAGNTKDGATAGVVTDNSTAKTVWLFDETISRVGRSINLGDKSIMWGGTNTYPRITRSTEALAIATNRGDALQVADSAADGETVLLIARNVGAAYTVQRVSMGAADSGGVGFKYLRVPN